MTLLHVHSNVKVATHAEPQGRGALQQKSQGSSSASPQRLRINIPMATISPSSSNSSVTMSGDERRMHEDLSDSDEERNDLEMMSRETDEGLPSILRRSGVNKRLHPQINNITSNTKNRFGKSKPSASSNPSTLLFHSLPTSLATSPSSHAIQFSLLKQHIFQQWRHLEISPREQRYITFHYFRPYGEKAFSILSAYLRHLGEYRQKMEQISEAISAREGFLERLHILREKWQRKDFGNYNQLQKELKILAKSLRWRTVDIVELISEWRDMQNYKQVWWCNGRYNENRENILFKVQYDLQFIRKSTLSALIEKNEIEQKPHLVLQYINQKLIQTRKKESALRKSLRLDSATGSSFDSVADGTGESSSSSKMTPSAIIRPQSTIGASRDISPSARMLINFPPQLQNRPMSAEMRTRDVPSSNGPLSNGNRQSFAIRKPLTPSRQAHVRNVFQLREERDTPPSPVALFHSPLKKQSDPFVSIHTDFGSSRANPREELKCVAQQEQTLLRLQRAYMVLSEEKDIHMNWLHLESSFFPVKNKDVNGEATEDKKLDESKIMLTLKFDEMQYRDPTDYVHNHEFEQVWQEHNSAAVYVQKIFRGYSVRKRTTVQLAQRRLQNPAALTIQKCWRQHRARQLVQQLRLLHKENLRNQLERERACVNIQRLYRGHLGRLSFDEAHRLSKEDESISIIQRTARKYLACRRAVAMRVAREEEKRQIAERNKAAVQIQRIYRGYSARQQWPQRKRDLFLFKQALRIQSLYRCFAARKITSIVRFSAECELFEHLHREAATQSIQTWYRCHHQRKAYIRLRDAARALNAARKIQSMYRRFRWCKYRGSATVILQRAWRTHMACVEVAERKKEFVAELELKHTQEAASLTIQTTWCRFRDLGVFFEARRRHEAAVCIQCTWRRRQALEIRKEFLERQKWILIWCQSIVRMLEVRKAYEFTVSFQVLDYADMLMGASIQDFAATSIQLMWKCFKARQVLNSLRDKLRVVHVQSVIRTMFARLATQAELGFIEQYKQLEQTVRFVQARGQRLAFRADMDRVTLIQFSLRHRRREHLAAIRIQCVVRCFLSKNRVFTKKRQAEKEIRAEMRREEQARRLKLQSVVKIRRLLQRDNKTLSQMVKNQLSSPASVEQKYSGW
eukprot:CAMPEP_0117436194 /NCGR_PEP_ID=MMETSP0759-20121206/881_1 /TAXON_ID=63605 /ORGANISM="Percolomonas cosmopolitus, Strain WS" /LENGTH=1141 /DNA_ID=CAMNT_0005227785 /DNA_START=366 /DNA_END=3788 /DNA_ORIENTATION=+